jgi:hypothetical protein
MKVIVEFDSLEEALSYIGPRSLNVPVLDAAEIAAGEAVRPLEAAKQRKRRTKAEIAADEAAAAAQKNPVDSTDTTQVPQDSEFDEPTEVANDFLDDDAPTVTPAAKPATKDEVRAALMEYQNRLIAVGKVDTEAARTKVLALLKKTGGADKLGSLTEDKFQAVINAAKAAK